MRNAVSYRLGKDGIGEIIFDDPTEKVNILTSTVMAELDGIISRIASSADIRALLFKSTKQGVFIAGADIREIAGIKSEEEAGEKSRLGQEIMNKISDLHVPTICVIGGACLGGGLELALACDYRIVSDSQSVRMGSPETTLGVIPGFGGTWRLTRLIGLARGAGMILSGNSVNARSAMRYGLADALYTEAFIDEKTSEFVEKILDLKRKSKKNRMARRIISGSFAGRTVIYLKARKELLRRTRGLYEAPLIALKTMIKNYPKKLSRALIIERKAFSKVAVSSQAKNLISVYFLNEELKKAYKVPEGLQAGPEGSDIKLAGLLGAGKMGGGIAWLFSNSDIRVRMKDISWQYVAAGLKAIRDIYGELEKKHKIEGREAGLKIHKVSGTIDYSGFQNADVVIEAITEDRDAKIKMLKELENYVRADSVIATNTSSFSIRELSGELRHPERFLGFHFFNPVNRMPLIEVIRGEKTSDRSLYKMINLARILKKIPVVVNDSNGFLVNRVLMSYLTEAVIMMEEGVDFTRIDSSIYNYGMPMGPFALMDEIGLKTAVKVAAILEKAYPERSVKSKLMPEFVKNSSLTGRSAGTGFYIYKKKRKFPNPAVRIILKNNEIKRINVSDDEITERCILRMINEAAYCLGERIIESPGHLDMALILGTGFPPFRGGLLRSADETGIGRICEKLREYEARSGIRYKTAPLLQEMNEKKGRFYK